MSFKPRADKSRDGTVFGKRFNSVLTGVLLSGLSSPNDKRQNDESGFCGVSSPSPRFPRGTGIDCPENFTRIAPLNPPPAPPRRGAPPVGQFPSWEGSGVGWLL